MVNLRSIDGITNIERGFFGYGQYNLISEACVKSLRLKTTPCDDDLSYIDATFKVEQKVNVLFESLDGNFRMTDEFYVIKEINEISPSRNFVLNNLTNFIAPIPMADVNFHIYRPINVLFNANITNQCFIGIPYVLANGLRIQKTVFNEVISGNITELRP